MRWCEICKTYNMVPCGICKKKADEIREEHNCGHKGETFDDWCNHDFERFPDSDITPCDCKSQLSQLDEVM